MLKYLRYSAPKDNELIKEFIEQYDVLIVNAHISKYYKKALSSFFHQNSAHYVIDPRTFIFQMKPTEIFDKETRKELSPTYKKLFECHYSKKVIDQFLGTSNGLSIEYMEAHFSELFNGGIDSQIHAFHDTEYQRYLSPSVLIAPSFALLKEYTKEEITRVLNLNLKSIKECNDTYGIIYDIGSILIMDQDILMNEHMLQNIIDCYSTAQINYLYLWIDDFKCFRSENNILKSYKKLINGMKGHHIIDLYADYSSFMLCSENSPAPMDGVCITAGYNESRTIRGVMGMSPAAKYYMRDIHMRCSPTEFMIILASREYFEETVPTNERAERFYKEVCDCIVCKEVIGEDINNIKKFTQVITTKGGRQQSSSQALILAQRHFLYAKLMEAKIVEQSNYAGLSRQLEDALLDYADYGQTGLQGIGNWLSVFKI